MSSSTYGYLYYRRFVGFLFLKFVHLLKWGAQNIGIIAEVFKYLLILSILLTNFNNFLVKLLKHYKCGSIKEALFKFLRALGLLCIFNERYICYLKSTHCFPINNILYKRAQFTSSMTFCSVSLLFNT